MLRVSSEKAGLMFKRFNFLSIKSWDMVNTEGLTHKNAILLVGQ